MDLGGISGAGSGAVACPVCTLYLREGISLQRHLDTHPKEQVIEALIKASSNPSETPTPPIPPSVPPASNSQTHQQVNSGAQMPAQSPYPMGPVFECPPINTMMPPQFASFSYQQFVNNGTMMIPQYAMAPQANQMMQMLYNPYSMYQQQQIPTVQMISPITAIPTTRIRPVVTVASEVNPRSVIIPNGGTESKQISSELLSEPEAERILPDIELPTTPATLEEETLSTRHESEDAERLRVEHRSQQTQNSMTQRLSGEQQEYQGSQDSIEESCENNTNESDKVESILPTIEEDRDIRINENEAQCKTMEFEESESQRFSQVYAVDIEKVAANDREIDAENDERKLHIEIPTEGKECSDESGDSRREIDEQMKETGQPEVEQLERLLITIMESGFDNGQGKNNASEAKHADREQVRSPVAVDDTENVESIQDKKDEEADKVYNVKSQENELCKSMNEGLEGIEELESNFNHAYRYRCSLSAPSSPVASKKLHRTYSVRSDYGSTENLNFYPAGFDATTMQDAEDEEAKNMDDNFDEEDMEIEEIASPHTPFLKQNENLDQNRSRTPLSAISGISVLRVRSDRVKPETSGSVNLYCPMDTESTSSEGGQVEEEDDEEAELEEIDEEEEEEDDEEEEEEDEEEEEVEGEEESRDSVGSSMTKHPIDCSQTERDTKVNVQETSVAESLERKSESNQIYHQSVITEHVSSFPTINSQQQPIIIHENYSMSSNKSTTHNNLLNLSELVDPTTSAESKSFQAAKSIHHIPSTELLNINEDAHAGPMNVFEFDGLQILVPSTFISESSQKAISATSQQSMASSEGGAGIDEEVKSVNMRADETMPPRGELSEQESNGGTEHSAWQLYMGQESSRMSTSYDLMARESWEESEGSDNEVGVPLLDSRSLATHFTSSLFLDRDRKTPTKRTFKCSHCTEVFDCPKERRVHSTTVHKEAGPSGSNDPTDQSEPKDIKLLDGRMNVFDDIFVSGVHGQQSYHHQQPLLHQLQPPQQPDDAKADGDQKIDNLAIPQNLEISCAMCSQRFSSERSLQVHNRRVHGTEVARRLQEISKCQICNEEFPSVMLFNAHLKIHPLECGQCGKYFYRKPNFKLHMKRHLGIKPFPCTVCDKAFLTKQKLDEHTNGHTGNAPVKCNLCNETFRRYSNLTQHKNRHHLNIKRKLKDYICHCGEVFHTKKKLAWHKETHDEKPKACTYCNERFIHMASLTRHMRRAHNRRFVPDAQRESENVECPICKCIYLRSSLSVHMRVHNGERPYECQVCSKAFSTKWNLQLHKWTHAARSTKPFKCNQCSAAFYRHSDYTAHMNSHRNVRPYTCNYCGAQFIRKYNCLRHVKEHEENKSYTCDICKKTFHRSYYLKEHSRVHSGARPYTCHICGKSSSTKSNHNKHVRIHHAREPVNTEN